MAVKRTFTKSNKAAPAKSAPVEEQKPPEPEKQTEVVQEIPPAPSAPVEVPETEPSAENSTQSVPKAQAEEAEQPGVVGMYDATGANPQESGSDDTLESDSQETGSEVKEENSNRMIKWLIVFIVSILILGAVAYFSYQFGLSQGSKIAQKKVEQQKASAPTRAPTPTEEASANLSAYSISILNGSGRAGEASTLQKSLDGKGFNVEKIGNAETPVLKTVISAKKAVSAAFIDKLKKELSATYTLDDVQVLANSSDVDVVIVIGSSKKE